MTRPRHIEESLNLGRGGHLTVAQRSNFGALTAKGYMSWRRLSLTLLSGQPFTLGDEARLFLSLCEVRAGQEWLDVGTSGGYYAGLLAGQGARVLATDISPPMLVVARDREPSPLISWARLNAEDSGLLDGSFDGVTIGATLNETAHAPAMLRECARLLRPGGQLWVLYIARDGGGLQGLLRRYGGLNFADPAQMDGWLPGLHRTDLRRVQNVTFERWVKGERWVRGGEGERVGETV